MIDHLSIVQKALFSLLQMQFGEKTSSFDFKQLTENEWNALYTECVAQAVPIICFESLNKHSMDIPPAVYNSWFKRAALSISGSYRVLAVERVLTNLLDKHNIPYVILKGVASAYYYPDPEKRASGDIDFLVADDFFDIASELLTKNGFVKEEKYNDNHISFLFKGISVELHFSIAGIPDGSAGKVIKEYIFDIVERSRTIAPEGFRVPCDSQHGVVILLHMIHHLLSFGLGIRHLCDWSCFVSATHNDSFWINELLPVLERAGIKKIAFIITDACVRYLNCPSPIWLEDVDPSISDEFVAELLKEGNFGRKNKKKSGTTMMVQKNSEDVTLKTKILAMLEALNKSNRLVYPILERYKFLYPFIMVWRILRYLFLMVTGKRQSITKASQYADERSRLYKKFELYKYDGDDL